MSPPLPTRNRASEFDALPLMYHRKPHLASHRIDQTWRVSLAVIDELVVLTAACSTRTDRYTSLWRHCCWSLWRWSITMVTWNIRTKSYYSAFLSSKLPRVVDIWEIHHWIIIRSTCWWWRHGFWGWLLWRWPVTNHHGEINIYLNRTTRTTSTVVDIWELRRWVMV